MGEKTGKETGSFRGLLNRLSRRRARPPQPGREAGRLEPIVVGKEFWQQGIDPIHPYTTELIREWFRKSYEANDTNRALLTWRLMESSEQKRHLGLLSDLIERTLRAAGRLGAFCEAVSGNDFQRAGEVYNEMPPDEQADIMNALLGVTGKVQKKLSTKSGPGDGRKAPSPEGSKR